ncbi:MAG: PilN domain-containing protein [Patescibacteria group bacterium]|nr:PilN domain-containing protein [Patescibacteria group bacterium]
MIELNLLPDIKLEYIRAQRERRLVISIAALVTIAAIAMVVLMFSIGQVQKKHLSDLNDDIKTKSAKLKSQPQIGKILTVQNQLDSLTALHDAKPATDRIFDYLNELTPSEVSLATLDTNLVDQTMTITGAANTFSDVNKYVDTLKFTEFTTATMTEKTKAFSAVVLTNFGVSDSTTASARPVSYTLTFKYDPILVKVTEKVTLKVPNKITTRSELGQPTGLFESAADHPSVTNTKKGQ